MRQEAWSGAVVKPWLPGDPKAFQVGDRAKWLGDVTRPVGATWNPPPPGWKPPSHEEREYARRIFRNMHVTVAAMDGDMVMCVRADDGVEFDPRVHYSLLVPASYEGWDGIHSWSWIKARRDAKTRNGRSDHDPGDEHP